MFGLRTLPVLLVALVLGACALPGSASARPDILGGPTVDVTAAPYVASLTLTLPGGSSTLECSGAIVDATHVLTSAHCFDTPGELPTGGSVRVGSSVRAPGPADAGAQDIAMAFPARRVHPRHTPSAVLVTPADIAVVTLQDPIAFGPRAQPIPLVAAGAYPATGAALVQVGYGKQRPDAVRDGNLHARFASAVAAERCGPDNAVELCYSQPASAGCPGDSGGPVVSGGVLVGINSSGECAAGAVGIAASLAAPEVRDLVTSAAAPPRAPTLVTPASISGVPQVGRTFTCAPGRWTAATGYLYAFEDVRTGRSVQTGTAATRTLTASDVGRPIRCRVFALSPGGVGQALSGTYSAVVPAPPPPPGLPPRPVATTTSRPAPATPPTPVVPTTTPLPPVAPQTPVAAVARPTLSVSAPSRLRRRTRTVAHVQIRTGPTAIGSHEVCVSVSRRARLVQRHGALRARTRVCRTAAAQPADTTRRLTVVVRATSRGAVRISARVTYPGGVTPLTAGRTVRAR